MPYNIAVKGRTPVAPSGGRAITASKHCRKTGRTITKTTDHDGQSASVPLNAAPPELQARGEL